MPTTPSTQRTTILSNQLSTTPSSQRTTTLPSQLSTTLSSQPSTTLFSQRSSNATAAPSKERHLPEQLYRKMQPGDLEWVKQCLYNTSGDLKDKFPRDWCHPPDPMELPLNLPEAASYFRQRLFIWAPVCNWGISLNCPKCDHPLSHIGLYRKAREVIDVDSRYYLVGEQPRCNKCKVPHCPWNAALLSQLSSQPF